MERWLFRASPLVLLLTFALFHLISHASVRISILPAVQEMAYVPAGVFLMGSRDGREDEQPLRKLHLDAFFIDKYEVTNAQYVAFLNVLGGHLGRCKGQDCVVTQAEDPESRILYDYRRRKYVVQSGYERHSVTKVSWFGAQAYCEHHGKRLPTEAEWEKAARGPEGFRYPWGNEFDGRRANVDHRVGGTTPVGSYPDGVSPYGVYDMAGNVWEWVADWYQPYPGSEHRSEFFGRKYKVVRGGSWNHPPADARTTARDFAYPTRHIHVVGFRCAR